MNKPAGSNCSCKINKLVFCLLVVFLSLPNFTLSQTIEREKHKTPDPTQHIEIPDDPYVPDSRDNHGRSPAYRYSNSIIVTTQVNVDANGQNIVGDAGNEPSIAIDRNNPDRMAIGWRQFNSISNNFRQAGYGYTSDGGTSWTFPDVIEPGIFRSDPVLESDIYGNFFYNSLTTSAGDYLCHVFKSTSGGSAWGNKTYAQGGDKQWMEIDKTEGPGNGNIYAFWTSYWSICPPGFFTRSTNDGLSYENCTVIPNEPFWGTLAIGPQSELYVAGSVGAGFQVTRSVNAQDSTQTPTWNMTTAVNLGGSIANGYGPNPGGLLGQTQIGVDTSGGPYNGYLYLLCSVERSTNPDPLDVMFARSTNGGLNWSAPVKINSDPGTSAYQWFGTMSVAPNGRIDVVWLDTRDNPGTFMSALYYCFSTDGGVTWSNNSRVSDFFNPHIGWPNQNKMGDYFDMVSHVNGASLAWAGTFNGEQDVYYSFITDSTIVPVEIITFTGSSNGNQVILNWSTATEINNQLFEIQRSFEDTPFITVGYISGKGTTTEKQNYTYTDNIPANGKYAYRLKQIDYQGSFEYSDIIELDLRIFDSYLLEQNYPNPFNPSTTIGYGIKERSSVRISILNAIGEEVALLVNETKESGYHKVEFNASDLPTGVYYYQLRAGEFTQVKKMLLIK